jgi:hypothetical protein
MTSVSVTETVVSVSETDTEVTVTVTESPTTVEVSSGSAANLNATDTSNFDGLLSASESTVQKALDALDDITVADLSLSTNLTSLTDAEVTQLLAINSVTVTNAQWGYLGAMSGQPLELGGGTMTGNLSFGDGLYVSVDEVRARDADGLKLYDDGGNGILVKDGGDVELAGSIEMENTSSSTTGIIFKNGDRFIHNFSHPSGNTAVPDGRNTFIGEKAGNFSMGSTATSTAHASDNVAIGYEALSSNTTGFRNFAIGYRALYSNTSGDGNVGLGYMALNQNTTGFRNCAVGYRALYLSSGGLRNNAFGYSCLYNNTGSNNTGYGYYTMFDLTSGTNNTAVGYNTGRGITTGDKNTIVGANVSGLASDLSNNIILADGDGNQRIRVDDSGNMGVGITDPDTKLDINGAFTFRELSSDPSDPDEGSAVMWMSDGTGTGDDGDVLMKITAGGVTKTATIADFSGL